MEKMTPAEKAATAADCLEAVDRIEHIVVEKRPPLSDARLISLRQKLYALVEDYKNG